MCVILFVKDIIFFWELFFFVFSYRVFLGVVLDDFMFYVIDDCVGWFVGLVKSFFLGVFVFFSLGLEKVFINFFLVAEVLSGRRELLCLNFYWRRKFVYREGE